MPQKPPFVSVIIPTYNMQYLVKKTIVSLFKQSYPSDRFEIIVVDNSSIDRTEEMIKLLQDDAPRTLMYYRKKNEGPGSSRNLGIAKANGSIIAFTDSDCIADPHWLKNGVAKMREGVGLVQGKTIPNPHQIGKAFSRTQYCLRENGMYQTCNMFYRKEVIDLVGGFAPEFCGENCFGKPRWGGEDTDLAWRVKEQGWKSVFADDAIIYHHVFNLDPWKMIICIGRPQFQGLFYVLPILVKKHPELRKYLYRRYFLNKVKAYFDLLCLSMILGILIHKVFFVFAIPYFALRSKKIFANRPLARYPRGIGVLIVRILNDIVEFFLLLSGSIWNRSIVL